MFCVLTEVGVLECLELQRWTGVYPELGFGGPSDSFSCPFHVRKFLTLLNAIGIIAFYGAIAPKPLEPLLEVDCVLCVL